MKTMKTMKTFEGFDEKENINEWYGAAGGTNDGATSYSHKLEDFDVDKLLYALDRISHEDRKAYIKYFAPALIRHGY